VLGYNAQIAVDENQIVLAAEIEIESGDFGHFEPMVNAAVTELENAGVTDKPKVANADAGYWNEEQIDDVVANPGIEVLIPPDGSERDGERPGGRAAATAGCETTSAPTSAPSSIENAR
jgi:hypothetical protein